MANRVFLLFSLIIGLFSFSNSFGQHKTFDQMVESYYKHSVPLISSNELSERMLLKQEPYILDTRKSVEYKVSHLPGAVYAGYSDFDVSVLKNTSKDYPIVVYCTIGARSEEIGEKLIKNGFTNVSNLYGGIIDWVNTGHQVVDSSGKYTDKVHVYSKKWGQWLKKGTAIY